MFLNVKERARQIALGQFNAPVTSTPTESLIDLAPDPKPATVATSRKTGAKEAPPKASASPSKTKLSKAAPPKQSTPKVAPSQKTQSTAAPPKAVPPKVTPTSSSAPASKILTALSEASTPKKTSSKSKLTKEPSSKPSSPKIGSSKPKSSSKAATQPKAPSSHKSASPTKPTLPKTSSTTSKTRRSKSPPKRVDSPLEDDDDPLSTLKSACLKQVSGVTGLGGRRLAIVLKQRSSGEWYAALKDTGSDKYLKMWMNRDKTFATKQEALEAYLAFATKMRNGVSWFPMSPRASSPKAKGK